MKRKISSRWTISPDYDEEKTTQAAVLLLKLYKRPMEYMKLIKLLYNIDREALKRWGRSVTYDEVYSLPHGLILSTTLDKSATSDPMFPTYWDEFIQTKGYWLKLKKDSGEGELSEAEVELITELFEQYKDMSPFDMEKEHHNPDLFPEWKNPGNSRIPTSIAEILLAVGYSESEVEETTEEIEEDAKLVNFLET